MEIRYILNVNYITWITLTCRIFQYNATAFAGYETVMIMNKFTLKNNWFTISCLAPNATVFNQHELAYYNTGGYPEILETYLIQMCKANEFQCTSGRQCIPKRFVCNNTLNCFDESDEANCPKAPTPCNDDEYKCPNKQCIPERSRCDLTWDCVGGEDELGCHRARSSNERPMKSLSAKVENITVNFTKAECSDTTEFVCALYIVSYPFHFGKVPSKTFQNHTVIDNTHEVMLNQKCNEPDIECETCRVAKGDAIAAVGKWFQLFCSTLMSFPTNQTNPYRFRWYIGDSNNENYKEIEHGFTNSIPSSDKLTKTRQRECVPLENKTSIFTFMPKMTDSIFINVRCQVVLDVERIYDIKETTKKICLCPKNDTDKIMITHQKHKCDESDIYCKKCHRPGVVIKTFGKSFNLSCSALMPFLGSQQTPNKFLWYIDYSNNGKYNPISGGFTNANPSFGNATQTKHPHCVSWLNRTSILTYKAEMWNSERITIKCEVHFGIGNVTETKDTLIRICLYEKGLGKRLFRKQVLISSLTPLAVAVIVFVVLAVAVLKSRRKRSKRNHEEKQQESTENDTKASTDNNKASSSHSTHTYKPSKKTRHKSYIYEPVYMTTKSHAADNVSDMATSKIKRKHKRRTSKDEDRSTKTKHSKWAKVDRESTPKSLKAKESSEYTYHTLPSTHRKSKVPLNISDNTITYSEI